MSDETIDQERREFLGRSAVVLSGVVAGASAMAMPGTALTVGGTAADLSSSIAPNCFAGSPVFRPQLRAIASWVGVSVSFNNEWAFNE